MSVVGSARGRAVDLGMGMGGLTSGGVGRSRVGWVEWPLVVCLWVCSVRLWAFVFGACCLLSVLSVGSLPRFALTCRHVSKHEQKFALCGSGLVCTRAFAKS